MPERRPSGRRGAAAGKVRLKTMGLQPQSSHLTAIAAWIGRTSRRSMLMLFCLLSLIFVASCQEQIAARPGTIDAGQQPEAYAGQAGELARNGNLHQGNFVIYCSSSWLVTARDSQIARLEQPGNTVSWLTGLKGSRLASHDRWLFYSGATAGSSTVRKVMPDGSNDVRISRASCQYLIADSQHLYAILNDSGQVVRFNHDGTGQQILFEGRATEMIYT
ncbi:MAG: DUF5050 domain-containing protein, partial [Ruminococcaceae bacterium]|nr:DUF5050 domain-containing protein [Oscillospiraceae bacterium]